MGEASDTPRRIVLFPYGPAQTTEAQLELIGFLIKCGADPSRIIDQKFTPTRHESGVDRYLNFLKRSRVNRMELERAIVVITTTNPPPIAIVQARRHIVREMPILQKTIWVVFADMQENPFLLVNLTDPRFGEMDDVTVAAPIWKDPYGLEYLIIPRDCDNTQYLNARFHDIAQRIQLGFTQTEVDSSRYQAPDFSGSR